MESTDSTLARSGSTGRIFLSVALRSRDDGRPVPDEDRSDSSAWNLVTFDPATGSWQEFSPFRGRYFWVSPDARTLMVSRRGALWLREESARERCVLKLPEPTGLLYQGAWAPSSRQFATTIRASGAGAVRGDWESWLVDIDERRNRRLPLPATHVVRDWSPDGEWLLTLEEQPSEEKRQIFLVRPDGSDRRMIATGGSCTQARFSPTGLAIASTRGPRRGLHAPDPRERGATWLIDADGTNDRLVFGHPELSCQNVIWSPDGVWLAASGFERFPNPTPGAGDIDLSRPFVALINASTLQWAKLSIPRDFWFCKESDIGWR